MFQLVPDDYLQYFEYLPDIQRCTNLFISFTPMFSYGTTCYGIYKKKTSTGFSIDICVTMLMASILRILYYMITPYEISLLRQSIVMVFIQCVLLKTSLHYRPSSYNPDYLQPYPVFKNELNSFLPRRLSASTNLTDHESYYQELILLTSKNLLKNARDLVHSYCVISFNQFLRFFDVYYRRPGYFWQWKEEAKYWKFLLQFAGFFGILTALLINNENYGAAMGFLGLFIESLLPLPQILLLKRLKSVKNFKVVLLLSWLGGDLTKISYLLYGAKNVSCIFISAGLFQMALDIIIAFQYLHYRKYEVENKPIQDIELGDLA